jgi:hypothetical protein
MIEPPMLTSDERERYQTFDRQRGERVSRMVGLGFAGGCALAAMLLGAHLLIAPATMRPASGGMEAALLLCIVLYVGSSTFSLMVATSRSPMWAGIVATQGDS